MVCVVAIFYNGAFSRQLPEDKICFVKPTAMPGAGTKKDEKWTSELLTASGSGMPAFGHSLPGPIP
jgi:hypothetical protein